MTENLNPQAVAAVLGRSDFVLRNRNQIRFLDAPLVAPEEEDEQWVDPTTLPEWDQLAYTEAEAAEIAAVPQIASKLSLVRAMRQVQMNGEPVTNPGRETSVWQVVKQALSEAPADTQEDWDLLTQVPRTDPIMLGFAQTLPFPAGVDADEMIDQIYALAHQIDQGPQGGR